MIAHGLGAVAIRGLQGPRAPAMVPVIGPLLCGYTVFDYFLPALHRGGCAAAGVATQALWPDQPFFPLERDDFSSNRHPALSFCLSMISGQTLRVCPAGKPVPHFSGSCSS
jgi:hypothetical protein